MAACCPREVSKVCLVVPPLGQAVSAVCHHKTQTSFYTHNWQHNITQVLYEYFSGIYRKQLGKLRVAKV